MHNCLHKSKETHIFLVLLVITLSNCLPYEDDITVDYATGLFRGNIKLYCNPYENEGNVSLIRWFKNNHTLPFYSPDGEEPTETSLWGSRIRFLAEEGSLLIYHLTPDDTGLYSCQVEDRGPTRRSYTHLEVVVPPENLVIMHKRKKVTGEYIGPFVEGETLRINCISFGGMPSPRVVWYQENELLDSVSLRIAPKRIQNELVIPELRRSDLGTRLTCETSNTNLTEPLKASVFIDMKLGPQIISLYTSEEASHESERRWFVCRIVGAHPLPQVSWFVNRILITTLEQNYTSEKNGSLVSSTTSMEMTRDHDESDVICCAPSHHRHTNYTCSKPIMLQVYYPPSLLLLVDGENVNETTILRGENVTLRCNITANPWINDFMWNKDDILINSNNANDVSSLSYVATEPGDYSCVASNEEGVQHSDKVRINVHFSPECVDDTPTEIGISTNSSVNITCNVMAEPTPDLYRWYLRNESETTEIAVTNEPTIYYEVYDERDYGTLICTASNSVSDGEECLTIITGRAPPREPKGCQLMRLKEPSRIHLTCPKQNIGRVQKFVLSIISTETDDELWSISGPQANMSIDEPQDVTSFKLNVTAVNEEGTSPSIVFYSEDILESDDPDAGHVVADVNSLVLWLALAVLGVSACACAIAICSRESNARSSFAEAESDDQATSDSSHNSFGGETVISTMRRSDSFRKAVSPKSPPSRTDLHRTNSFRTPACLSDDRKYHSLKSMRNASRSEAPLCDRLIQQLQDEFPNYNIPKPPEPFYTIPRRLNRTDFAENASLSSHVVDGLPLPPPPEEFQTVQQQRHTQMQEERFVDDPSNPFSDTPAIYGTIGPSREEINRSMGSTFRTATLKIPKPNVVYQNRF